jgi:hypothetical protein
MRPPRSAPLITATLLAAWALAACERDRSPLGPAAALAEKIGNQVQFADPTGTVATYSTSGALDMSNPFFKSLGTNGRSCGTCHLPAEAFSLTPATAQARFAATGGHDPLFAAVDGANCPDATPADGPGSYGLLLNHALIRVFLPVPAGAQYTGEAVYDPYGCALVTAAGVAPTVSVYRRPLPTTNLTFLSAVMFDGRETAQPLTAAPTFLSNLRANLVNQARGATLGHAEAAASPTDGQLAAIADFQLGLFTAQATDDAAGVLNAQGASGGPRALASQTYFPGINDPLGDNPTGAAFDPEAFTIFAAWRSLASGGHGRYDEARAAVARGQDVFNTHPLTITGVKGLNDDLGVAAINGTCTTCHDSPNVGNHSRPVPLDIGTSHASAYEGDALVAAGLAQLSAPDLPVFRLTRTAGPLAGAVSYTSDPAKALISGRCADIGRGKGPILRGLAARAPFFHNGAAANLAEVVNFYNARFQMGLTEQERADLVAFLNAL